MSERFALPCAECDGAGIPHVGRGLCSYCNGTGFAVMELTDAMVGAAKLAASKPMDGCGVEIDGGCSGMHTDRYYRAILTAALRAGGE